MYLCTWLLIEIILRLLELENLAQIRLYLSVSKCAFLIKFQNKINWCFYVPIIINASRPAITIPLVGKTLVQAGTTTAGSITAVFSVIGIAMGIWEVVGSAKKIQDGSELANEFREQANELEKVMKNLIELDEELQS